MNQDTVFLFVSNYLVLYFVTPIYSERNRIEGI